jgi:hypothetical protein
VHCRPFREQIDVLAIDNRALGAEEIRRHYQLGTAGERSSEP